jgi:hypothetical protein
MVLSPMILFIFSVAARLRATSLRSNSYVW